MSGPLSTPAALPAAAPAAPGVRPVAPSDEALEGAWRRGSRQAFSALFRRHYRGAVAYALQFVGDAASAEDVVQQAFLNLLQRRRGQGRFKALLYTCVRNLALNERRRRGRRYVAQTGLREEDAPREAPPLAGLVAAEERDLFQRAVAALEEEEREAFCLKETRGLTYAEVGRLMGLHPDAVRRRVAKAFARVRAFASEQRG